ncbi:hypothetical protein CONPUDRAFT_76192 [Coniophora puteana RWD-64-598 SS2]|uniref:Uncharacterized protein n=1 Tax=Coniophora puteana (strain RWD-64-598) TaxID=741705 RepID=A0A5M3MC04_CONPW|nr:uncharacterized protein CONPUDRAFT_76192 [Coniophora puteana RWD-64-598 SS2]EIW76546.1 hypothetical protein CONPUDRAFT_76192 [Coniophora puteana RWD-64-598 SS2]
MKSFAALSFLASVAALVGAQRINGPVEFVCEDLQVLSTSYIGDASQVKAQTVHCANLERRSNLVKSKRAAPTNVCGAACTTNCFTPSGGGPNPNDCQVIADALLYDSQNTGNLFNITIGTPVYMQYATCETFFVNQASVNQTYCRDDWSTVTEYVADNCQSTQNAHGGNCVADDGSWFIQIQAS